jgi:hypothetical protein
MPYDSPPDRCRYFTTKRKGSSKKHQRGWEGKNSNDEGESTNLSVNQQLGEQNPEENKKADVEV